MNTKLIALIAALLIGSAAYVLIPTADEPHTPAADGHQETKPADDHTKTDVAMEEHKRLMNDGETFMAMSNEISPPVLYAKPGQELTFASHEPFPVQLKSADGTLETALANPGDKHSTFIATTKPGKYELVSSHDANVKATLVVEE